MNIKNIVTEKKTGRLSFSGREVILYTLDIPRCDDEKSFLNDFFALTAENYLKYLEDLLKKELAPKMKAMIENSKRSRDIRNALGIPIKAALSWSYTFFKEKYLSLLCESRLSYANGRRVFTIRTLCLDTETMVLKKARDISKKASGGKYNFYIKGSKMYTFGRNFAVCEDDGRQYGDIMKISARKIDNI